MMIPTIRRGDIFYADLSPVIGSEQGGLRPVLIVQNDVGNRYSPTVIAADRVGLAKDSVILLEQIRTIDKRRLKEKMGHLDDDIMNAVNNAIAVSFGLGNQEYQSEYERHSAAVAAADTQAAAVAKGRENGAVG